VIGEIQDSVEKATPLVATILSGSWSAENITNGKRYFQYPMNWSAMKIMKNPNSLDPSVGDFDQWESIVGTLDNDALNTILGTPP